MKGNKLDIHEALIEMVVQRNDGKNAYAQFTCDGCNHSCSIPREAESKSVIKCCRCEVVNYLDNYEVIVT